MAKKRMVLEIGMGTDIRGADPTKAACRALRDALWHNTLSIATALGHPLDAMIVDVQERWPGASAADLGLNVAKLIKATELLGANNIDPDEEKFVVVNARQVSSLLKDTRVASVDYNVVRPLVEGTIVKYMGFTIIPTQLIGVDGNSDVTANTTFTTFALPVTGRQGSR